VNRNGRWENRDKGWMGGDMKQRVQREGEMEWEQRRRHHLPTIDEAAVSRCHHLLSSDRDKQVSHVADPKSPLKC
jgi:hypothetical protein